jgi:two-component system, cell cycle response regulator
VSDAPSPPARPPSDAAPTRPVSAPPYVLVVDDSPLVRRTVERLLSEEGYRVRTAGSGEEAFSMCLEEPPRLVVSDVNMQGLSGMQLCRLLRHDPATAHSHLVLLTCATDPRSRFWGSQSGADAYITKERAAEDLLPAVSRLLAARPAGPGNPSRERDGDADPVRRLSKLLDQHLFQAVVAAELRLLVDHLENRAAFTRGVLDVAGSVTRYAYLVLRLRGPGGPTLTLHVRGPWPGSATTAALRSLGIAPEDATAVDVVADDDVTMSDGRLATGEMAWFPIEARGEILGDLGIFGGSLPLDDDDRSTARLIATELGLLVQSLFLMEETLRMAHTDALTGVASRRAAAERLELEIARAARSERPMSVTLCDLDHFKRINDEHGHGAGDEILRRVAATLQTWVRNVDLVGRWGGEEFLIVLPDASEAGARVVAERLRAAVAALELPEGGPARVTLSAGAATWQPNESPEQLLERADAALYRAKDRGRNRVEVARVTREHGSVAVTAPAGVTPRRDEPPDGSGS